MHEGRSAWLAAGNWDIQAGPDLVLVLGEHLRESIRCLDEVPHFRSRHASTDEALRVVDVCAEMELPSEFLADGHGVARQHFDVDSELLRLVDGLWVVGRSVS